MVNKRIFWAAQAVLKDGSYLDGVQAVGVDGNVPITSIPDMGRYYQKFRFENLKKEFSINISRVLNKSSTPFYTSSSHLLSSGGLNVGPGNIQEYDITIVYGSDAESNINSVESVTYKSCLITSLNYNFNVDGLITEDIGLLCRAVETGGGSYTGSNQDGNILKREDIGFTLPTEAQAAFVTNASDSVDGVTVNGLQSINIGISMNYQDLPDVGQTYNDVADINKWTYMEFPVSVTASFTGVARALYPDVNIGAQNADNFPDTRTITVTGSSFTWSLGDKNYFVDYSVSGGDAGGGNVELTMNYTNEYSDFTVT